MRTHEFAPFAGRRGFALMLSAWGLTGQAVEVGTHRGEFAEDFLHNWPGSLHCVDPWGCPSGYESQVPLLAPLGGSGDRDADFQYCRSRLQRFGERVKLLRETSKSAVALTPDRSLDFVYIDGDHSPASVCHDLWVWWEKLKPGGVLAGHDYLSPNEPDGMPGRGVAQEVDRFGLAQVLPVFLVREVMDSPWSFYLVKPCPVEVPSDDGTGSTREDDTARTEETR